MRVVQSALVLGILMVLSAFTAVAADIVKADNTTTLNLPGSWTNGVVPTANDYAVINNVITADRSTTLGVSTNWLGIKFQNPGNNCNINAGNTLTLGTGGIDMSSANRDFTINCLLTVSGNQTWNVASGRTLNLAGSATISGSSTITKAGTGTLQPQIGSSPFTGKWILAAGVTRISADTCLGAVPASVTADSITLNGGTLMNRDSETVITANRGITLGASGGSFQAGWGRPLTINGIIAGTGALTIIGDSTPGRITLTAANTYSGATTVNGQGWLIVNGSLAAASAVTVRDNGYLGGNGTVNGTVSLDAGGVIGGGDLRYAGTLTVNNNLSLGSGAIVNADLADVTTVGGGVNDLIQVNGNLTFTGPVRVNVSRIAATLVAGTYRLMNYTGTLTGGANLVVDGHMAGVAIDTATAGEINLVVTDPTGANLTWRGGGLNWDYSNFAFSAGGVPTVFADNDAVRFDDSGFPFNNVNITIDRSGFYTPASVVVDNTIDYTFGGNAKLAGPMNLTKSGPGVLILNNGGQNFGNEFTGIITIAGGTVRAGYAYKFDMVNRSLDHSPLGNTNKTVILSGGTLDVNNQDIRTEMIEVQGAGVAGNGAIVSYSGGGPQSGQNNALRHVTLTGPTTFGGTTRWDVRLNDSTGFLKGNTNTLTKVGVNQVNLVNLGDTGLGDIIINDGWLGFEVSSTLGDPTKTLTINPAGTLQFYNTAGNIMKKAAWYVNSGRIKVDNNTMTNASPVTLSGTATFEIGGSGATQQGQITGAGNLLKTGAQALYLEGYNTYSGYTRITGGSIILGTSGSIANSPAIYVASGTTFNAGPAGGYNVESGKLLAGSGTVGGLAGVNSGGTVSPGDDGTIGTFTFANGLALNGGARMNYDLGTATTVGGTANDLVAVTGDLALNGVVGVSINPLNGPLVLGSPYRLINYTGALTGAGSFAPAGLLAASHLYNVTFDTATAGQVNVTITSAGSASSLVWQGDGSANDWDLNTTANWNGGADKFFTGDNVLFNDVGSATPAVNLTTTLNPSTLVVDSTKNYTFSGPGKVSGNFSLVKQGNGTLVLANAGINDYSKPTIINGGVLQVGNGGVVGNIGPGTVTNNGVLRINRSDDLTESHLIVGTGGLVKDGPNTVTVSAANSFAGPVTVAAGTLKLANAQALGNQNNNVVVANGAQVDFAGISQSTAAQRYSYTVAGFGPNGRGAIYNSGAAVSGNSGISNLTLTGNTLLGVPARFDIGLGYGLLDGGGYTLIKDGASQLSIRVSNTVGLVALVISNGLAYGENFNNNLGTNIVVYAGGSVGMYGPYMTNSSVIKLEGGGIQVSGASGNNGTNNYLGPIYVNKPGTINTVGPNGSSDVRISGLIYGSQPLSMIGGSRFVELNTDNSATYSGALSLASGMTLRTLGNGTLGTGPVGIAGTLDLNSTLDFNLGALSGPGTFNKNNTNRVTLAGDGTMTGPVNLNAGVLRLAHANALGGVSGTITVVGNITGVSVLELAGGNTFAAKPITLQARQQGSYSTPHLLNVSGNNTWTGPVTLTTGGSEYNFQCDAGKLTIAASISASGLSGTRQVKLMGAGDFEITGTCINVGTSVDLPLVKLGAGKCTISSAIGHNGLTTIAGGTLALAAGGSLNVSTGILVAAGATFDASAVSGYTVAPSQNIGGSGTVLGNATMNVGGLIPGSNLFTGTLTFANDLTLNGGGTIFADLANVTTVGGNVNDLIQVNGNLTLAGMNTIQIIPVGGSLAQGTYRLINYAGTLTGGAANLSAVVMGNSFQTVTVDDSTPGQINLVVAGTPASISWFGDPLSDPNGYIAWDLTNSMAWFQDGMDQIQFHTSDNVLFDDTVVVVTNVMLVGSVMPGSVTVNATTNYAFSGSGKISGGTGLLKRGNGTLFLNTTNDYIGPTTIEGGMIRIGNTSAFGSQIAGTWINGGTLDLNGVTNNYESIIAQGSGVSNLGAIYNSGTAAVNDGLRSNVTFSGNVTLGGVSRWDIFGGKLYGNSNKLTKVGIPASGTGNQEIALSNLGESGLGDIDVQQGMLTILGNTTMGDPAATVLIQSNAILNLWATTTILNKQMVLSNGGFYANSGSNLFVGPVSLVADSTNVFDGGATLNLAGVVSGPGAFSKTGGGTVMLSGNNSWTGGSYVTGGTLQVGAWGTSGNLPGDVFNNGTLSFARTDASTYANNISGGGTVVHAGGSGQITLTGTNSNANLHMQNGTLTVPLVLAAGSSNVFGYIGVGKTPSGALRIEPDAFVLVTNYFYLGEQSGQTGAVVQAGGTVKVQNQFRVGHWGNNISTYRMEGGSLEVLTIPTVSPAGPQSAEANNGAVYIGIDGVGILTQVGGTIRTPCFVLDNRSSTAYGTEVCTYILEGGSLVIGQYGIRSGGSSAADANTTYLIKLGGGTVSASANWDSSRLMQLSGVNGPVTFDTAGFNITLNGVLSGPGGLVKQGAGTLLLNGANTYAGATLVNAGTLGGTGTLQSALTVASTGTVAPGASIGTLTVNNAVTLSGRTVMEVNRGATPKSDLLVSSGLLTYGGTLEIVNLGAALQAGDTFNLFDAASFTGSFSSITLPTLADGLAWKVGALSLDGTLMVVQVPGIVAQPQNSTVEVCQTATFTVNASGTAPLTYQWYFGPNPIPGAQSATLSLANVTLAQAGSYSVLISNGEQSTNSAAATLTVLDSPPVITTCVANQSLSIDTNCTLTLPDLRSQLVTADSCGVTVVQSPAAGTVLALGSVTTVTFTVSDPANNQVTCNASITVVDSQAPIFACPSSPTAPLDGSCTAAVPDYTNALAVVECNGPVTYGQDPAPGTSFTTTQAVTIWAKDSFGNSNGCVFTVTAVDTAAPTITTCPPAQTAPVAASCQVAVPDFTASLVASDNCTAAGSLVISQNPPAGTLVGFGPTTVVLAVKDAANNTATCNATFTATDPIAPVITACAPADRLVACDPNANLNVVFDNLVYDNSVNDLNNRFNTGSLEVGDEIVLAGTERYIRKFVFEYWGANSSQASFVGNVQARVRFYANDGTNFNGYPTPATVLYDSGNFPVAATPRSTLIIEDFTNAVVPLNLPVPSTNFTWSVQFSGLGAGDSAGPDLFSPPVVGGSYPDYWEHAAGNWSLKTNPLVALDFAALVYASDTNVVCAAAVPDLTGEVVATDNCGIASVTQVPAAGTLVNLGTIPITLTAHDAAGNVASCVSTILVTPLPEVTVQSKTICLGDSTTLTADSALNNATYAWTPGGETTKTITVSPAVTTAYQVVVTDISSGLSNTANATVTVNVRPVVSVNSATVCPGVPVTLAATHDATNPSFLWMPGGATTPTLTVTPSATTTYTVTVTDGNTGCASSASGTVTVLPWHTFANSNPVTIRDNATATPYPSTINVSGLSATVCRMTVTLNNVSHSFPEDIDIILVAPNGGMTYLLSDAGSYESVSGITFTLDDLAPLMAPENDGLVNGGVYKPTNYGTKRDGLPDNFPAPAPAGPYPTNMTQFAGMNANGTWSLYVMDDAEEDQGVIAGGWSIAFATDVPFTDVSVAVTDAPDPVAITSNVTFTVTASNLGLATSTNLVLRNLLPATLTPVSYTASQGSCALDGNNQFVCNLGDLAAGASATVTVTATATVLGPVTSTVQLVPSTLDFNSANNTASTTTTVMAPPAITGAPQNLNVCVGATASFTVVATGTAPLSYQWYFGANPIAGATGSVLNLANVQAADLGTYSVVVLNPVGSATASATIAFYVGPTITAQPVNVVTPMGNTATFSVTATSPSTASYQWYMNGAPVAGGTSATLALSNVTLAQAGNYQVVVGNCGGISVTSQVASLTVIPMSGVSFDFNTPGQYLNTPYFRDTSDWVNSALPAVPFEVVNGGVGTGAGSGALDMTAGTTDNTSVLMPLAYDFSVDGRTLFASVMVKVKAPTANNRLMQLGFQTLNVSTQVNRGTQSSLTGIDGNAFMTVRINSTAQPALTYQLEQQNKVIAGTGTAQGSAPAAVTLTAGNWYKFTVAFTNIKATVANSYSVVGLLQDMGADGQTAGAVVSTLGPANVANADIVNARGMWLAWRSFEGTGADYIDNVAAYTSDGPVYSVRAPLSQTVLQGRQATFNVLVDGKGPYTYQWFKNGIAIPNAGNWKYVTPPTTLADNNAQYTVTVTGPANSITSGPATLTVQADPLSVVSVGSIDGEYVGVRFNQPVDKATAETAANYTVNGTPVAQATLRPDGQSVSLAVGSMVSGTFTVVVQNVRDLSDNPIGSSNTASGTVMNLSSLDVNAPLMPGESYSAENGGFELIGGGADIWGTADQFRYVYGQRTGDFDVRMQVPRQDVVRAPSKAALVMREVLDPPSRMVFMEVNPVYPGRNYISTGKRDTYGASANAWTLNNSLGCTYPNTWMRFRRVGNTFYAYIGTNGVNWTLCGQTTAVYPPTVYLGVGACAVANAAGTYQRVTIQNYTDFSGYPAATLALLAGPTNITVNAGATTTMAAAAAATGITNSEIAFQWQRSDGLGGWTNVPTANGYPNVAINASNAVCSFTTPAFVPSDSGAQFRVIAKLSGGASVTSSAATVTVNADTTAPTIASATVQPLDVLQVVVVFSEPVGVGATVAGNYMVTNAVGGNMGVVAANYFATDLRTVVLTVTSQFLLGNYAVVVNNVKDLVGNTIAANSVRTFSVGATAPAQPVVIEFYMRPGDASGLADVYALTNLARFNKRKADSMVYNNVFGWNTGLGDSGINYYGGRAYTYFVAPSNGVYKFWIRADDAIALYMNTNGVSSAGKVWLCESPWVNANYRTNSTMTFSGGISLTNGQRYYMEALWKEGGGGDGFSIAVRANSDTGTPGTGEFIPASLLAYPSSEAVATPVLVDIWESFSTSTPTLASFSYFTNDARYIANTPTSLSWAGYNRVFGYNLTLADSVRNGYGARLRSYFVAPSNGVYRFYGRADDTYQLFMNTNAVNSTDPAGARLISSLNSWTGDYTTSGQNVALTGGQRYYIEARFLEGGGGDGFSLAVRAQNDPNQPPGGTGASADMEVADGSLFEYPAALDTRVGAISVAAFTPVNPTIPEGQSVTFAATGLRGFTGNVGYLWLKNGVPMPAPNAASYAIPPVTPADNGAVITLIVTNLFSSYALSSTITVTTDTTTPTLLLAAGSQGFNQVTLLFNEPVLPAVATFAPNYTIPGLNILYATIDPSSTKVSLWTSLQTPGQNYSLTLNGIRDLSASGHPLTMTTNFTAWAAGGAGVYVEIFTNIGSGSAVINLQTHPKFVNNTPDLVGYVPTFGFGTYTPGMNNFTPYSGNPGLDNYGLRMSTLFVPPSNGLYRFYIKSDDASALYMNTNGSSAVADLLIPTSTNCPAGQEVAYAIDRNVNTKYLNFDKLNSGFNVMLKAPKVVTGLRLTTAGDAIERDPLTFTLEGTTGSPTAGPWTLIASGSTLLDGVTARLTVGPVVSFANATAYSSYRLRFPTVRNAFTANSMQIAEVELLDGAGINVIDPGKMLIAQETDCCDAYGDGDGGPNTATVSLIGGQPYYLEGLMKEGGGGDYLHVAVRPLDETGNPVGGIPPGAAGSIDPAVVEVIGQQYLLGVGNPDIVRLLVAQAPPSDLYATENELVTVSLSATAMPPEVRGALLAQWSKFDPASNTYTNIPGAIGQTLQFYAALADDSRNLRLLVSLPSTNIYFYTLMHVVEDLVSPQIVSVNTVDGRKINVCFSERLDVASGFDMFNYRVFSGATEVFPSEVVSHGIGDSAVITLSEGEGVPIHGDFSVEVSGIMDLSVAGNPGSSTATGVSEDLIPVDINTTVPGSEWTCVHGQIDMSADGADIWGNADGQRFAYREVTGNFDIHMRVQSLVRADVWSKAGLMARTSTNANARNYCMLVTPTVGQNTHTFQWRLTDGGASASIYNGTGGPTNGPAYPNAWVRLQRSGSIFAGYYSTNGVDWLLYAAQDSATNGSTPFPDTLTVGIALTSHLAGSNTVAQFRDLYFPAAPTIITQPAPANLTTGLFTTVSYTVDATLPPNSGSISYQWWKDGAPIPGATTATLTLNNVQVTDSATYVATAGADGGRTASQPVTLVVSNTLPVVTGSIALTTPQDTPVSVLASDVLTNAYDPESALHVIGVKGLGVHPLSSWTANFDAGLPAGASVWGQPTNYLPVVEVGGIEGSGRLTLTPNVNSTMGTLIVSNFNGGQVMPGLRVSFQLRIGDGTADAADGFSFNYAPIDSLPRDGYTPAEDGVTTNGLAVCIDNYPAAGPGAPSFKVRWQNAIINTVLIPKWNGPDYVKVDIALDPDGKLTVSTNGVPVFANFQLPGYVPSTGEFGFYARTGGENETHWLDDIRIDVVDPLRLQKTAKGVVAFDGVQVTYTPDAGACGADNFSVIVSDGQIGGTSLVPVDVTITERVPTPPVIVSCAPNLDVPLDGDCLAIMPDLTTNVVATDNCCCVRITQLPAAGTLMGTGQYPVQFTVTDTLGLTATCIAVVNVLDANAPVLANCPAPQTITANESCQATLPDYRPLLVVDDCRAVTLTQVPAAGLVLSGGTTTLVEVVATDIGGLSSTCAVSVAVLDLTAPVLVCPPSQSALVDQQTCQVVLPDLAALVGAIDNCGAVTRIQVPPAGTPVGVGLTNVLVTVTDAAGNASTCTVLFEVQDPVTVELAIRQVGANLIISWPKTCTGFTLHQSSSLTPPISWTPVAEAPVLNGSTYEVTTPAGNGVLFYELRR